MVQQRAGDTREKLLTAAGDVFAEKGFRDATVAEICRRAKANISAVNYYFGSKTALYQEAWRYSFAESIRNYPQNGGVSGEASAEERLRGQLTALIERIADGSNRDFFISQMEFANPTGLLDEVMRSELIPLRENTLAVVRDLLGPEATEQQVGFCETCVISMCFHPMLIRRVQQQTKNKNVPVVIDDLAAFTDHVLKFALAGIAAVKSDARPIGGSVTSADMLNSKGLSE